MTDILTGKRLLIVEAMSFCRHTGEPPRRGASLATPVGSTVAMERSA